MCLILSPQDNSCITRSRREAASSIAVACSSGGGGVTLPHTVQTVHAHQRAVRAAVSQQFTQTYFGKIPPLCSALTINHTHTHRACINLTSLAVVFCFCVNPKQKLGVFHENLEAQSEGNKAAVPLKSTGGSTLSQTHRVKMNSSTARYKICLCASFYPNVSFTIRVWPI